MDGKLNTALNQLITQNYNAEQSYKQGVEKVEDPRLVEFFKAYERKRYEFGHDLKGYILTKGGNIHKGTSLAADIEKIWVDLKAAITSNDEFTMVEACRVSEMNMWETYNHALTLDVPLELNNMLMRHRKNVDEAVNSLMELKEEYAHA